MPARSWTMPSIVTSRRTARPVLRPRSSQARSAHRTRSPPTMRNGTIDSPNGVISLPLIVGADFGYDPAPRRTLEDAEHDHAEARRRQRRTDEVERGRVLRDGVLLHPPAEQEDDRHDHDLAHEHVAPREVRGHPAADDRPDGDGRCRDPADEAVREGPLLALVVRGDERGDRGHDEHGTEALDQRPAEQQDRKAGADRRDQRPSGVDREAHGERPVLPPDVADLCAGEHERRHDERVRRDRELDALDRGVEVLDDLRDRDVHDGAVEHHHELGGGEDEDRRLVFHVVSLGAAGRSWRGDADATRPR